jgi:hypothetical protein
MEVYFTDLELLGSIFQKQLALLLSRRPPDGSYPKAKAIVFINQ